MHRALRVEGGGSGLRTTDRRGTPFHSLDTGTTDITKDVTSARWERQRKEEEEKKKKPNWAGAGAAARRLAAEERSQRFWNLESSRSFANVDKDGTFGGRFGGFLSPQTADSERCG